MKVTITGYENFQAKKDKSNITTLYYIRSDEIDPRRGKGNRTESAMVFGKKLTPEIGDEVELEYEVYDWNGEMRARVTGIK